MVPLASTVEEAKRRLETYDCYDWWFCYDKLVVPEEPVKRARMYLDRASNPSKYITLLKK